MLTDIPTATTHGREAAPEGAPISIPDIVFRQAAWRGPGRAVWLGQQVSVNRPVLIHLLLPSGGLSAGAFQRFLKVADRCSRLTHLVLSRVYASGWAEGTAYVVAEPVEGIPLDRFAALRPSTLEVAELVEALASALQHAHEHGLTGLPLSSDAVRLVPMAAPLVPPSEHLTDEAGRPLCPRLALFDGSWPEAGNSDDLAALGSILESLLPDSASPMPRQLAEACRRCRVGSASRFASVAELARELTEFRTTHLLRFSCSACRTRFAVGKPARIGRQTTCPSCGKSFRIARDTDAGSPPQASQSNPPTASALPFSPPSLGRQPTLPGYTILKEIGRGAMGVVYKARDERLRRVVALKLILEGDRIAPDADRFRLEAEAAARLHHPNVIQIYEVGEVPGHRYIALEFAGGGSLQKRLQGQPQPVEAAAQLVEQVARAVHVAHTRGILHRDLKPANILLVQPTVLDTAAESAPDHSEAARLYGVPKVADFGLAKRLDEDLGATRHGEVIGTPLYMAPEQARGQSEQVRHLADVYALGVILYEMLTGKPPFQEEEAILALLNRVASEVPPSPRQMRPDLPRALEAICLKCLEKAPRDRYPTALALADDLRRFLKHETIHARPLNPVGRLWSWSLRNSVAATLLLTLSLSLTLGLVLLTFVPQGVVTQTACESAAQQSELIGEFRGLYSEVTARARERAEKDERAFPMTHFYPNEDGALPIPMKTVMIIGERLSKPRPQAPGSNDFRQRISDLRVYSRHPLNRRSEVPNWFDEEALTLFEGARPPADHHKVVTISGARYLRFATPILMEPGCLKCHNDKKKYPGLTREQGWAPGNVRGVLVLTLPLEAEITAARGQLLQLLAVVAGVTFSALALCVLAFRFGRRR